MPEFLQFWFRANYLRLRAFTEGRGGNQPNLNGVLLRELEVPLPPVEIQRRIAADLSRRIAAAEKLARHCRDELAAIDALPAALLREAFNPPAVSSAEIGADQKPAADGKHSKGIFFKRGAVASYIVEKLYKLPAFGRVHLEKNLYLAEAFVGIDLEGRYKREAAGPLDADFLYKLESLAGKLGWFTKHRRGAEGFFYRPGPAIGNRLSAAETILGDAREKMDQLLERTAKMTTEQVELFATVFAAWNDRIITGEPISDALIIEDVRERWHDSKKRFEDGRLKAALEWMRKEQFVPVGLGRPTTAKK